jgi:hypothetical protein
VKDSRQDTQPGEVRKRCETLADCLTNAALTAWGEWEMARASETNDLEQSPGGDPCLISKKIGEGICPNTKVPGQVGVKAIELSQSVGLTVWQTIGYIAEVTREEIGISGLRARFLALGSCMLRAQGEFSLRHFGRGIVFLELTTPWNRAWRHYFVSTGVQGWRGRSGELTGSWRNRPPQLF